MRRYHFAGRFSQVWHADAGRKKGGVRLCQPLDGHPQPPLLFCDTLPDCSVILRLSSNYSPLSVAHFYAFANPFGKYPIYSHIPMMSRRSAGRFLGFVRARFVRSLLLLPPGSGQLTHFVILWHTVQWCNIPLRQVFPRIPPTAPGYLQIDNLGGVDAKSSMGVGGSLSLPAGPRSLRPYLDYRTSCFSQVYNRVISEWSIGLFISISGSRP